MALTTNQERLLEELWLFELARGKVAMQTRLVQLANATDAQVETALRNFAGEQKLAAQAALDTVINVTIPALQAKIAFYDSED